MKRAKKIKIVEKKLGREKAFGQTWQGAFLIEIDPRQKSKTYLNTLIHEILHNLYPDDGEAKIKKNAGVLTHYIWEKDYRRMRN